MHIIYHEYLLSELTNSILEDNRFVIYTHSLLQYIFGSIISTYNLILQLVQTWIQVSSKFTTIATN